MVGGSPTASLIRYFCTHWLARMATPLLRVLAQRHSTRAITSMPVEVSAMALATLPSILPGQGALHLPHLPLPLQPSPLVASRDNPIQVRRWSHSQIPASRVQPGQAVSPITQAQGGYP